MTDLKPARSKLWDAPILRAFAPPAEPTVDVTEAPVEITPWGQPGTRLRVEHGAAARGKYAPAIQGAPSTTRQAEILNTALIGPPTGTTGVVTGRDVLSRTSIAHDPITAYNSTPREVSSPNVIIMGDVGAGKSTHTKANHVLRPLLLKNRRCVVFDKKDQAGEGEYSGVVRRYGYEPIKFSPDGKVLGPPMPFEVYKGRRHRHHPEPPRPHHPRRHRAAGTGTAAEHRHPPRPRRPTARLLGRGRPQGCAADDRRQGRRPPRPGPGGHPA